MIQPEDVAEVLEGLKPYFTTIVEVQLKDYGESANAGCWVSFRVPSPEDLETFRGQDRSGRNARTGKRYTLMLIELNDQEEHVQTQEPKARKLAQIAGGLCHDEGFRAWLQKRYDVLVTNDAQAADLIRVICGVESRSLLDSNLEAAELFRGMLAEYDKAK